MSFRKSRDFPLICRLNPSLQNHLVIMFKCYFSILILSCSSLVSAEQDLLSMYKLAEQNDPLFAQVQYQQNIADEIWWQRMGKLLPGIGLSASTSQDHINNTRDTFQGKGYQKFRNSNFSIDFVQPLVHWDFWVELNQADNIIAKSESDFYFEQQSLMVRVSEAYFNVLASQDKYNFSTSEKLAIKQELEQAKESLVVGLGSQTDVYEAESAYAAAVASEIEAFNELDDSKELLKEIVGDIDIDLKKVGSVIPLVSPVPEDMNEWASIALQNNLEIISAFNTLEISRKEIYRLWNGHLPTIDLVGNYALTQNKSSFGLEGDAGSIGVQLNLSIFEGGTTQARIREAEYQFKIEQQKLESTKRQVKKEVRNAYRGILSDVSRIKALKTAVSASEQAVQGVRMAFREGTRTLVDVLIEQRALYRNRIDYADARYTYLLHGLSLKKGASSLSLDDLKVINGLLKTEDFRG